MPFAGVKLLSELRDDDDSALPAIEATLADAPYPVEVLPVEAAEGERTLVRLQVTTRSVLGALALHFGGLLVDHGWIRILGGGRPPLNLATANDLDTAPRRPPGLLIVAFDVLGGRFAINGGALPGEPGEVCHFSPDDLEWLPMEMGHGNFVAWTMSEHLAPYYEPLRWPGWEAEVAQVAIDQGISLMPPPFTAEGRDLAAVSRRAVPINELFAFYETTAEQLAGVPDGSPFRLRVTDE